ncbi:MAG: SDR family oxidoreductase [Chthoniobacterales bacterium]
MKASEKRKTVLVTGSTQNLGFAIATAFTDTGACVVVHGQCEDEATDTRRRLKERAPQAEVEAVAFDLGKSVEIERGFAGLKKRGLLPDVLVNNAANLGLGDSGFLEQSPEFFRKVLEVNLFGVFYCSQLAAAEMKRRGRGSIVNISSLAGERAVWGRSAYNTSKAALDGLTRSMVLELAEHGIRINTVVPGYVWTPRWEKIGSKATTRRRKNIPVGVPTTVEEIARLVLFLALDEGPTLLGARVVIDGGLSVQQVPKDAGA